MSTQLNRRWFTVSNTPGTGNITVSTAQSGYATLGASNDGQTYDGVVFLDGTSWEVRNGCTYTHSGTTLSRGTLEESSTGSAISLTSATTVMLSLSAARAASIDKQLSRGIVIVRNDGSTTQSLSASTFTKLSCINTEVSDPSGWWDNSNQKFLPTRAGRYLIVAGSQITMVSAATLTSYLLIARLNGSDYAHLARGWIYGAGNIGVSGSCIVDMNGSTDYVEPFGWQNDSASRTTVAGAERQFFMASYLSDS